MRSSSASEKTRNKKAFKNKDFLTASMQTFASSFEFFLESLGNALARVQRIHKPVEILHPQVLRLFNTIETLRF